MSPEDRIRLRHMAEAARAAQEFVSGRNRSDLDSDRMLLFAVVRALEIVGEAATKLSDTGRDAVPGLPWAAIVGMRHRIVHADFAIDPDVVWQTVVAELPELVRQLDAALAAS